MCIHRDAHATCCPLLFRVLYVCLRPTRAPILTLILHGRTSTLHARTSQIVAQSKRLPSQVFRTTRSLPSLALAYISAISVKFQGFFCRVIAWLGELRLKFTISVDARSPRVQVNRCVHVLLSGQYIHNTLWLFEVLRTIDTKRDGSCTK